MLLVMLCACYWIVAGVEVLARGLVWLGIRLTGFKRWRPETLGRVCAVLLITAALGSAVPKLLEPLHSDRTGFREAGLWLAEHVGPDDAVYDPYRWTSYYAGQDFRPAMPMSRARTRFVVLERSDNPHDHGHLFMHQQAAELSKEGQKVYCWCGKRGKHKAEIDIYALPRP
jgi:hypothetical protein